MKFNVLRDCVVAICFLALLLLIAVKIQADAVRSFTGRYRAVDGDSLALGTARFRLLGIDAPELSQSCLRAGTPWRCGDVSRRTLASFVAGDIECRGGRSDKYRRLLVTCFRGAVNINREMVLRGMAVAFGGYEAEERQAQGARLGVWAGDFDRPSDWRRTHKAGFANEAPHPPSFLRRLLGDDSG